jgi:predicted AAA+ superfamily ATPase
VDYRSGRFLLTGSANVLTLRGIADSLAARIETIRMLPLVMAEIEDRRPTFLGASSRESYASEKVNYSQFGSSINAPYKASPRYVGLLEHVVLIETVHPWFTNAFMRLAKRPKLCTSSIPVC